MIAVHTNCLREMNKNKEHKHMHMAKADEKTKAEAIKMYEKSINSYRKGYRMSLDIYVVEVEIGLND